MAAQRKIIIRTALGSGTGEGALLVRSATVTERLGRLYEMDLELLSTDEAIDFDKVLGHDMTLTVSLEDGSPRHFHGYVNHLSQGGRLGRYAIYKMRAVPWTWFLTRTQDCKIFQNATAPNIIKEVFRDLGFGDVKDSLTKTYRSREYCVQYRETDFNFVQRLMEEEGIYYFFTHTEKGHKLVLADSYSGHATYPGYESIDYYPPSDNESREKDHIHEWNTTRDIQSGKFVITDYDFTKPRAPLQTQYVQKRTAVNTEGEMFDYPGGYAVVGDGDHYARTKLESLQSQYERTTGIGNARGLAVGSLFKLQGYPRKDQNREYLVVGAVYQLHGGDFESGTQGADEDFTVNFEAISSKEPFRTEMVTPKPTVGGPQTAVVTGPGGEEIFTDKYGRVKVKFFWDRGPEKTDKSSCWIRVSQIWAGKNWGWMSIPRMGQEVVVDFLEGDPDQPLITGRVYNQDNMPPWELPANKTQSGIMTRSTLSGTAANFNALRFEDKKGSEQLFIHAEKNQDIEVENDETHWVGHDRTKTIDHDETVHVKHDRTETVDNNETISVGANRTETVGSNESISIGSNQSITVGASRTEDVASNETVTVGSNRRMTIGANEDLSVGSNRTHTVGGNETLSIGANHSATIGKKQTLTVADAQETSVGKDAKTQVGKKYYLEAGDEITLKTGSASLVMKKDGTIELKGKDITLSGSGKINVKASSDVTIKGSKIAQN